MKKAVITFCAVLISTLCTTAQNTIVVRPTKVQTQDTKTDPKPNPTPNPNPQKHDGKTTPQRHSGSQGTRRHSHEAQQPQQPKPTTGELHFDYGTWTGGILNGKPDGKGRLLFTESHRVDRATTYVANPGDYFIANYSNGSLISGKLYDSNDNLLKTIIP